MQYSRQCSAPNRGTRREAVFDKMAVHRSRRDEENMLIMAVAAYTFESKARGTSKARGKITDFGCMCVGIRRKYQREVQKTQINLFGNPA